MITFKRRHDQKSAKSKQEEEEESESKVSSNHEENNYVNYILFSISSTKEIFLCHKS